MSVTKWWAHLVDSNIVTAMIADLAVTTLKLAADAVTGAKIADDSIDSEHYVDGSIDQPHLADGIVNAAKLAAQAAGNASSSALGGSGVITSTAYVSFHTASFTPTKTTSKVTIHARIQHLFGAGTTTVRISRAGSLVGPEVGVGITTQLAWEATEVPGSVAAQTYSIDVKNDTPAGAAGSGQLTFIESV